jgi:integrase/recombinase XerD
MKQDFEKMVKDMQDKWNLYGMAKTTIATYTSHLRKFLYHFNRDPKTITQHDIEQYILPYTEPSTREQIKSVIAKFYKDIMNSPRKTQHIPKTKSVRKLPVILSPEEIEKVIAGITKLKQRAAIQYAYSCALRSSEVRNTKIGNLNKFNRTVHIQHPKGNRDRFVPVPTKTLELLRQYVRDEFKPPYNGEHYLFPGQNGPDDDYSARSLQLIIGRAVKKAGILVKFTMHKLRHSRATHLHNAGMSIHNLSKFLGHKDIKTTQIYLQTGVEDILDDMDAADSRIEERLNRNSNPSEANLKVA